MLAFTPIPTVKLGFFELSTHGLLMAAAFLAAEILARRAARRRGLSAELVDNAAIVAIIMGLVGARLVYILFFGGQMTWL
jgi:phosphatidylglycerol:prolipoprotein diacylglycerol transferase